MTTIEKLNLMANALVFAHRKQDLLEAASQLSALQKENAELKEKNVAWALGIERSNTDIVDMQRDEFMRIKALLHASESPSDREIIGICNRAIACIEQTVPVVVQRDNLEKEAATLRTQNRELREALLRELNYWENYTPNMVACPARHVDGINKAVALQPEK